MRTVASLPLVSCLVTALLKVTARHQLCRNLRSARLKAARAPAALSFATCLLLDEALAKCLCRETVLTKALVVVTRCQDPCVACQAAPKAPTSQHLVGSDPSPVISDPGYMSGGDERFSHMSARDRVLARKREEMARKEETRRRELPLPPTVRSRSSVKWSSTARLVQQKQSLVVLLV